MRTRRLRRLGVYAGSFDPLTVGHMWMIEQGSLLFDHLVVAIGSNPDKDYAFTLEDRIAMLKESLRKLKTVSVDSFSNRYLVDFARSIKATHILRGIRTGADYEFERAMRYVNGDIEGSICTVFLMPPREIAEVSSSMVKGLVGPKNWQSVVRPYVPVPVYKRLLKFRP